MKKIATLLTIAGLTFTIAACTPDISSGGYSASSVQDINAAQNAYAGVITSAMPVNVSGENGGMGTAIGAVAGGIAGSAIGGGTRANLLGGVGGAVVGGLAGKAIGDRVGNQQGMRYVVKLETGKSVSVVQGVPPVLQVGQKVNVLMGGSTRPRVIPAA